MFLLYLLNQFRRLLWIRYSWIAISILIGAFVEAATKNKKLEKRVKNLEDKIK